MKAIDTSMGTVINGTWRSCFELRLGLTESPIEGLLLNSFCALAELHGYNVAKLTDNETLAVEPQKRIGPFRVDFAVCFSFQGRMLRLAIECDGYEFHDRTKQQAVADKARDRALMTRGYQTLRFAGSEIWNAPSLCAGEILNVIMDFQSGVVEDVMGEGLRHGN